MRRSVLLKTLVLPIASLTLAIIAVILIILSIVVEMKFLAWHHLFLLGSAVVAGIMMGIVFGELITSHSE
jgi:hypothetical protein